MIPVHIRIEPNNNLSPVFVICGVPIDAEAISGSAAMHISDAMMHAFGICPDCIARYRRPARVALPMWALKDGEERQQRRIERQLRRPHRNRKERRWPSEMHVSLGEAAGI